MNDLVSIIMGVMYTRSDTKALERSIKSLLSQSYTNYELIICERNSSIQAKIMLENFAREDNRIILLDGIALTSLSAQLNMCLRKANGGFIARMDDDDFSHSNRLQTQIDFLKKNSDVAFVGCNVALICDGEIIGQDIFAERPQVQDFLFRQPFVHPAIVFRKDALEEIGGYSELPRCERCEDYDLLLRLYENGFRGANVQDVLFSYTLPPGNITTRTFHDRVNEMKTRYARFRDLKLLPGAFPYVIKPIVVWAMPSRIVAKIKRKYNG